MVNEPFVFELLSSTVFVTESCISILGDFSMFKSGVVFLMKIPYLCLLQFFFAYKSVIATVSLCLIVSFSSLFLS